MPERLDRITVALTRGNITITWDTREALIARLQHVQDASSLRAMLDTGRIASASAAPRHIRPAAALGPVKYMRNRPSARRDTSGAQNPPLPAQVGFCGSASPRTVHGPVAAGDLGVDVAPPRGALAARLEVLPFDVAVAVEDVDAVALVRVGAVEGDPYGAVRAGPVVGQVREVLEPRDLLPRLGVEDPGHSLDRAHGRHASR